MTIDHFILVKGELKSCGGLLSDHSFPMEISRGYSFPMEISRKKIIHKYFNRIFKRIFNRLCQSYCYCIYFICNYHKLLYSDCSNTDLSLGTVVVVIVW